MSPPSEPDDAARPVVSHLPAESRFALHIGTDRVGLLDYESTTRGSWRLVHTAVRPDLRGRGLAGVLVAQALATARREGITVHPVCPYVVAWLARHPEWSDIVV